MIIVTGAAGFIGSCLISRLNRDGIKDIIAVDDFGVIRKSPNLEGKQILQRVQRDVFIAWLHQHHADVDFVFHIGARTDTTELNQQVFDRLNTGYSKALWDLCRLHTIPMVYASSAATYGSGALGYSDSHELIPSLRPLNPYGMSKQDFDTYVLDCATHPPFWAGLKFFNVYGPNEFHKGRMASVVFHAYRQISDTGKVKLFRSHRPDFANGMQVRDFIYVKDVVEVLVFLMHNRIPSAIYNLGSGKARAFLHLANAVFSAMQQPPLIEFIDTPIDIRDTYQYFTCAEMEKLREAGFTKEFTNLENGIEDYVKGYLEPRRYY